MALLCVLLAVAVIAAAAVGTWAFFRLRAPSGPLPWSNLNRPNYMTEVDAAVLADGRILRMEFTGGLDNASWRIMEPDGHGGYTPGSLALTPQADTSAYNIIALDSVVYAVRDWTVLVRLDLQSGQEQTIYQGSSDLILCGRADGKVWFSERSWSEGTTRLTSVDAQGVMQPAAVPADVTDAGSISVTDSGIFVTHDSGTMSLLDFQGNWQQDFTGTTRQVLLREDSRYRYTLTNESMLLTDKGGQQATDIIQGLTQKGIDLTRGSFGAFEFGDGCFYLMVENAAGQADLYRIDEASLEPTLLKSFVPNGVGVSAYIDAAWLYMLDSGHFWVGIVANDTLYWTDVTL